VEGGGDKDQAAQEVCGVEFSPGNSDLELSHGEAMSSAELRRAMEEIGKEEEEEVTKDDDLEAPRMERLAAIPDALAELSSARRSKRRAGEVDEFMGLMAEWRKSIRNEGTSSETDLSLHSHESNIVSYFHSIGVTLGTDLESINASVASLKNLASFKESEHGSVDRKSQVIEKDEQDRLEEEELDKKILKNICGK
jgi:hypothetical protein